MWTTDLHHVEAMNYQRQMFNSYTITFTVFHCPNDTMQTDVLDTVKHQHLNYHASQLDHTHLTHCTSQDYITMQQMTIKTLTRTTIIMSNLSIRLCQKKYLQQLSENSLYTVA